MTPPLGGRSAISDDGFDNSRITVPVSRTKQTGPVGQQVSQTALNLRTEKRSPEEVRAELRRLRAEIRADNPGMTAADRDALADRLGTEVKTRLGERAVQPRSNRRAARSGAC